jgi:hypothetical protein
LTHALANDLSPILYKVLDPLEGGDELERHEAVLVALDVLQQELVLRDVRVRKVKLHLPPTSKNYPNRQNRSHFAIRPKNKA